MQETVDVTAMLRSFREVEKPRLEAICSIDHCTAKRDRIHLWLFLAFMLTTTTIYMAWNVNRINRLDQRLQHSIDEQNEGKTKASKVLDEMLRIRSKQAEQANHGDQASLPPPEL